MADSKKDIKITAGLEVKGDSFDKIESSAKAAGGAIKSAFSGAFSDITRVLTVGNAIGFGQAIDSAKKYREEVGRLSATAGPVGQLRAQIDSIGAAHLIRPSEIVDADRGLGRLVYSAKNAMGAIGGLQDEALATGQTLAQKIPLGAALMNGLGVAGSNVADELGRVRDLADKLGTSGGLIAAEDRLTSMAGLLVDIGAKTDADRAKLEAMALGLGKGLVAQAGSKAAAGVLGAISGNRETFAALSGMKISALTNADGSLNVDAAMTAAEKTQAWIKRQSKDRGMQQMIATSIFGGDRQAGAAALNADFRAMREAAATARNTGATASEAAAFRNGEAGQAIGRQIAMENSARRTAEGALPVTDAVQGFLGDHPLSGGLALGVGGNLAGQGVGSLLGKMGEALMGGGAAVARGGAAAGASLAAGGAAAGASMRAGAGAPGAAGKAGSLLGKAGLVAAAGAAGYAIGTEIDEATGLSGMLAGVGSDGYRKTSDEDADAGHKARFEAREKRKADTAARANALVASFKRSSDPTQFYRMNVGEIEGSVKDNPAINRLGTALATGTPVDSQGLSADSIAAIKAAIESAKLNVTIENHSDSPLTTDAQNNAGGMKN